MQKWSKEEEARRIIAQAIDQYDPSHVFALFSGGHDSLCASHVASSHPAFDGCVHINTGIGIEETRQFVRNTCKQHDWPLREISMKDWREDSQTYEDLVLEYGFPGPGHHWKMYHRLKERPIRALLRQVGSRKRKVVFVSGRRKQESARRMVNVDEAIKTGEKNPSPRVVWVNPLINWSGRDKNKYIAKHDLKKNRVVEMLCMSGECLCGAFAKPGELDYIRGFYPEFGERIDSLAEKVKACGKPCKWGESPKTKAKDNGQMQLCFSCIEKMEADHATEEREEPESRFRERQ